MLLNFEVEAKTLRLRPKGPEAESRDYESRGYEAEAKKMPNISGTFSHSSSILYLVVGLA